MLQRTVKIGHFFPHIADNTHSRNNIKMFKTRSQTYKILKIPARKYVKLVVNRVLIESRRHPTPKRRRSSPSLNLNSPRRSYISIVFGADLMASSTTCGGSL